MSVMWALSRFTKIAYIHLLTICKSFIWHHLDYGSIYYQPKCFILSKPQPIQCDPALGIAGAKRVASRERSYHELGLGTIVKRRWHKKLGCFSKIVRNECSKYQVKTIPTFMSTYNTRNTNNIPLFKVKRNFENCFYLLPLLNGTNWTKIFAIQKVWTFSKRSLLKLIFVSLSLTIAFKIHLTQFVINILKRKLISFFAMLIIQTKDQLPWIP